MSKSENLPVKRSTCLPIKVENINELWEIDVVGPLQESIGEKIYLITFIDVFSRRGAAYAVRNKNTQNVLKCMKVQLEKWGKPGKLLTDNGLEFKNNLFEEWCSDQNITIKHGSPYTPSTQGAIERFNQSLIKKLSKITEFGLHDWEDKLDSAISGYNSSFSRPIGCTPYELWNKNFGANIDFKYNIKEYKDYDHEDLIKIAQEKIKKYKLSYEKQQNKNIIYKIGDEVWYYDPSKNGNKLQAKWDTAAKVLDTRYDSCKLVTDSGKIVVAYKRHIQRRF